MCVFIEGHFTWKIGSLVTAGKVGNSLVTAGGRHGYGRKQCLGIVVKMPCGVAVTDRAALQVSDGVWVIGPVVIST